MGESRPDIQHRKERIVSRGRSGWGWFRFPWRSADDDCLVVPKPRSIDRSFDVAALSDVGTVRSNNEDAVGVFKDLGLVVLADGMGGHERGEVASQLAIETVRQVCRGDVEVLGKKTVNRRRSGCWRRQLAEQISGFMPKIPVVRLPAVRQWELR